MVFCESMAHKLYYQGWKKDILSNFSMIIEKYYYVYLRKDFINYYKISF